MTQPSEWEKKRDELARSFRRNAGDIDASCEADAEQDAKDVADWARAETLKEVAELVDTLERLAHEIDLSDWQLKHGSPSIAFFHASREILKAIAKLKEKV